jgi:hypothetical protein
MSTSAVNATRRSRHNHDKFILRCKWAKPLLLHPVYDLVVRTAHVYNLHSISAQQARSPTHIHKAKHSSNATNPRQDSIHVPIIDR